MLPTRQKVFDAHQSAGKGKCCSEQLAYAQGCFDSGDFEQCIDTCRLIVVCLLQGRSDGTVRTVLATLPRLSEHWRLVRSEIDLCLDGPYLRGDCGQETISQPLLNYAARLIAALPSKTVAERVEVTLRSCQSRLTCASVPLHYKKILLRVLVIVQQTLIRFASPHRTGEEELEYLYGALLHEPRSTIRRRLCAHRFWNLYNYSRRLVHLENRAGAAAARAQFSWPEQEAYRKMTQGDSRSRVLVTIHMGDFYGAFRIIAAHSESGRGVISLRRERSEVHSMRHFMADKLEHTVLHHGSYHASGIVSALRGGGQTLAVLFDLRSDFGETTAVEFFGVPARFVRGPAQLAIMGRAPVIPFVCYEQQGRYQIDMAPVIESDLLHGESLAQGVQRLTQQLVSLAEKWIRRRPEQWKYLDHLPGYFVE